MEKQQKLLETAGQLESEKFELENLLSGSHREYDELKDVRKKALH